MPERMPDLSDVQLSSVQFRTHAWVPPSVSNDVSLASVHSLRVILPWSPTETLPRVSAVPTALARAVPSARCWPAAFLAASL